MIAELRGIVVDAGKDFLVIDTNGVGFEVRVTSRLASSFSREDRVHVYTRLIIREDAWNLYGFKTREERACFDLLLSVRGVGAKVSLSVISYLQPQDFYRAILAQDDRALVGVPGVGKKTAGRMILELRDRIGLGAKEEPGKAVPPADVEEEAQEGLMALGYTWQEAKDAVSNVRKAEPGIDLETLLREALRKLARS
ncbi:MAG: Holliday junction branch migration protein RuvA [Bacillota bacterium]